MADRHIIAAIACHNRRETTLACLAMLQRQILPPDCRLSVVLVDDGSRDGTAAAVRTHFPETEIIAADGTLYWAGAMILAERRALQRGADFVLWLNDDVVLLPNAVAALLETSAAGPDAIAIASLADPDTGAFSYGGQLLAGGWHRLRLRPALPNGRPQPCDTFQGNSVLVPAAICRRLHGIDAVFHGIQGMADTEYGFRARQHGIPLLASADILGECRLNRALPPWRQPQLGRRARLRGVFGPRGMAPAAWFRLTFRHGGGWWPLVWLVPQLRAVLAALTTRYSHGGPPTVALIEGVATIYRLPFYRGLAERQDMVIHIHDGRELPRRTADQADLPLPLPCSRGTNLYWPDRTGRIAWSSGVFATLRRGADVAVVGQHVHDLAIWFLWLWRALFGRPRLLAMGHFRIDGNGLRPYLRRLFLKGIDAALCYTEAGRDACLRHGVAPDRVFAIGNTLDTASLLAMAAERRDQRNVLRQRLGIAEGEAIFLFVGRLYAEKRLDLAVAAIADLRQRGFAARLVVIGDGELRDLVMDHPGITWLGKLYDDAVLADWFAVSLAMLMPDRIGLAAVHALANEVPVIGLANGVAHSPEFDYLKLGKTALLAMDVAGLADNMQTLIEQPDLQAEMAVACRRKAASLSMTGMVEQACRGILHVAGRTEA